MNEISVPVHRRCKAMFWLEIRLSPLLRLSPEMAAAALGCSSTTIKERCDGLYQAARQSRVALRDDAPAHALLRALYRADGGGGAVTEEGWRHVLEEARAELLAHVRHCCETTLRNLGRRDPWSSDRMLEQLRDAAGLNPQ